jgi:hypothetical protein
MEQPGQGGQALVVPTGTAPAVIDKGILTGAAIKARVDAIYDVMQSVMKEDIDFGKVPGTDKPSLWKAGGEKLCLAFRIASVVGKIDDLSGDDEIRYRITVQGVNQITGEVLGEGVGECSSNEEKYRWRRTYIDPEWEATPADRRREKWMRGKNNSTYKSKQIRTSPADVANTVLKMAHKRAFVAMVLVVTGASGVFGQDYEDLPPEVREAVFGTGDDHDTAGAKNTVRQPERKAAADPPTNGNGKSAPAPEPPPGPQPGTPYKGETPTGYKLKSVEPRKDSQQREFFVITAHGGFQTYTKVEDIAKACQRHVEAGTIVELVTKRREGFPIPQLEEVAPVRPGREPGSDDR